MLPSNLFAMFANFRSFSNNLDHLLNNPDLTIEQLLDEDNLISALNMRNSKLLEYLTIPRLSEILDLVLIYPPEGSDSKRSFKFPFVATEIFCSDCSEILEKIIENDLIFEKFFMFFEFESCAIQVGYFSRIFLSMLSKHSKAVFSRLKELDLFSKFLNLIHYKSFCEVIEKVLVLQTDLDDGSHEGKVNLVKALVDEVGAGGRRGKNAVQVLVNIIESKEIAGEVARYFDSDEALDKIFQLAFEGEIGLQVVKSLLTPSGSESFREEKIVLKVVQYFPRILELVEKTGEVYRNTLNEDCLVLGKTKLVVIQIIHLALLRKSEVFESALKDSGILESILKEFWKYEWSSFLHIQVLKIIETVLMSSNSSLQLTLLRDSNFLQDLMKKLRSNPRKITYHPEIRPGYDGVLVKIANLIKKFSSSCEEISSVLEEREWTDFLKDFLEVRNLIENRELGGYSIRQRFDADINMPLPQEDEEEEEGVRETEQVREKGESDGSKNDEKDKVEICVVEVSEDEEYWRF